MLMQSPAYIPYPHHRGKNSGRIVLHSDLNSFFASVECANDPELKKYPVAVCGDIEERHGIILAKNEKAKLYGVATGEPIFAAKKKCPSLVTVKAHYSLYMRYSRAARNIYRRYTENVEPFGMDEAWLELTGNPGVKTIADGKRIADEIREKIREELGITASVGVSDNKSFAKLGSDYKKPDATTVLSPDEYENIIAPLPVSEILYAGKSTTARLSGYGIYTIGQVASCEPCLLRSMLGKNGISLYERCRGEDHEKVAVFGSVPPIRSVGNSTTPPHDIENLTDARLILSSLCDNVCSRLRSEDLQCRGIAVSFRNTELMWFEKQIQLGRDTDEFREIFSASCKLFSETIDPEKTPLRSLGVRAINLSCTKEKEDQLSLFDMKNVRQPIIEKTIDEMRKRFGFSVLTTAFDLCDTRRMGHFEKGYEVFRTLRN